ncbi:hypothetical protein ACEWY4_017841 [Coilia grayii]|uniref:YqaJ viral recombinase domain-containing protein n=1 Tax=Coilia grayii TaxID=363190 RepID=A0ABD1JHY3_9TELE
MSLFELLDCFNDMEGSPNALEKLKSHLGDDYGAFSPTLLEVDHQIWTDMTEEERKEQMLKILEELIASSEEWAQGQIKFIKTLINDPKVPEHMCKEKIMHLVDAGLFLNSPYPPMLTARDIDLIVSFDFSAGDPFQTLKVASDYAAKIHRPFPAIDVESLDKDCPGSFYVFEERGKPTVIHIPLFNMDNCKDEATIKKEQDEYTTFQLPYRDPKKINDLADLAAENACDWGIVHEEKAKKEYMEHTGVTIQEKGVFLSDSGVLGCSPDGMISNDCIIEVKCPYAARKKTTMQAAEAKDFFLQVDEVTGLLKLKQTHNHWHQIQGNLHLTGASTCHLVVWTPLDLAILLIHKDAAWASNVNVLETFYRDYFLPHVLTDVK